MSQNLSGLLKWGIENSTLDAPDKSGSTSDTPPKELDRDVMEALFGGPSEADLMVASMKAITSPDPEVTLQSRLVAFDNLEQLVESLDNANNLDNLSLWPPLLECLAHEEREIRCMAAWCVGTAVQNNVKTQERLHALGGIPPLLGLVLNRDEHLDVKKKAIYAISSAIRNHQPSIDACLEDLEKRGHQFSATDAANMDAVDLVIDSLRRQNS